MSTPLNQTTALPSARTMRIATISASWHKDLLDGARDACISCLAGHGVDIKNNIDTYDVPGAFEIPLMAQKLARSSKYDGIITFGFIVDGGIYRHEFVTSAVIDGLMRVQLDTGIPVFSCVLTPHHFHEHADHLRFYQDHLLKKGSEVADSAFAFMNQLAELNSSDTPEK